MLEITVTLFGRKVVDFQTMLFPPEVARRTIVGPADTEQRVGAGRKVGSKNKVASVRTTKVDRSQNSTQQYTVPKRLTLEEKEGMKWLTIHAGALRLQDYTIADYYKVHPSAISLARTGRRYGAVDPVKPPAAVLKALGVANASSK